MIYLVILAVYLVFLSKNAKAKALDSVNELKAEYNGLKENINNLEAKFFQIEVEINKINLH